MGFSNRFSLIKQLTITGFKLRYRGSVLGYFWSLLNPLLLLLTLYIVFALFMKINIPNYPLYLLIGILTWNFLSEGTVMSINSMVSNRELIRKMKFPTQSIIISSCVASFVVFLINLLIFFLLMVILKVNIYFTAVVLPFYLIELFMLVLGLSLFLSALYVRYKDVIHIWNFFLLLGFWITPIVYSTDLVPFEYLRFYMLNPLARIIVDMRGALLDNFIPTLKNIFITTIISILTFVVGYVFFKKSSKRFAEEI
ncbi:MAG: ABC transporter permease [Nanoarchaeota archaeon]|nr:ABC transporter permease [Nanoarchaeota archaeon]MBU1269447.1 ABC transporter permease [Nanoarchaeota archaeon]MBU1604604.1 ABC transporter permease [Nanoarchaeota archaeon]MBU2442754.1 ABC transporter permease [Nanoarchaeota archaeon]